MSQTQSTLEQESPFWIIKRSKTKKKSGSGQYKPAHGDKRIDSANALLKSHYGRCFTRYSLFVLYVLFFSIAKYCCSLLVFFFWSHHIAFDQVQRSNLRRFILLLFLVLYEYEIEKVTVQSRRKQNAGVFQRYRIDVRFRSIFHLVSWNKQLIKKRKTIINLQGCWAVANIEVRVELALRDS